MRVLMIGPFAWSPKGTVSARAFLIARALVQRGHQVVIIMPPYDNPARSGYSWERDGVSLVNERLPTWGDSLCARLVVPPAMVRHARQWHPDLVHVFKPIGYAGLTGMYLRAFLPRLPIVLDCDDWEGRGGWVDVNRYPRLWGWFFAWQEAWLARRANVVTVASRVLQVRMTDLRAQQDSVFYLPNGPNPVFRDRRRVSSQAQRVLRSSLGVGEASLALYIGHISYESEVSLIIESLLYAAKAVSDLRVVIMGAGEGIPGLRRLAEQMGVAQHLVFTGWVDPDDTPVYLAAADLALYPYRDTLVNRAKSPSKITAYMAMGKPIVASAVGEIAEYLDGGRAGLLVEPDNARAFADGMIALLNDPIRAKELAQRAEHRIWQCYDWDHQVENVERAYALAMMSGNRTTRDDSIG